MDILKHLNLPPDAEQWLTHVWDMIQMFDDIEDGDPVKNGNTVMWNVMVDMPLNPFWIANQTFLLPVMIVQILKWKAANTMEDGGKADERSYMYRAGFWDLVLMVCYLCHGRDIDARGALLLYGETFAEYSEEFSNA